VAIARGIRRYDGRAAFATWAYRVATNACIDELRRRRRRPVPDMPETLGVGASSERPSGAMSAAAAPPAVEAVADRVDIDAALALLPQDFRAAVVLRDLCDLDYAEIAQVLRIPPGTVRSRIARGRSQLADLLGNPPDEPDRPSTRP
jgi:RNA polymerase sigma-70 factor, ECF subfamily